MRITLSTLLIAATVLPGCSSPQPAAETAPATPPAAQFLSALAGVCGQAFSGKIVANTPPTPNDPFEGQALVIHVHE